ncbi:hypothetical protein [Actinoallomurus sp. NPDC050550]|uniref:hypothetical protein n=1 Tax=Actinoallomurus sp. NPDC050550 TaxID=3154937 RepID=UPI0033D65FC7
MHGHFGDRQRLFLAALEEAQKAAGIDSDDLASLITDIGDTQADLRSAGERPKRQSI